MIGMRKGKREEINQLVQKLKEGDSKAFDILYREYSEKIFAYTKKILKNNEDAEDAVMDTFMSVSQNIGDLRNATSFNSWLYTIARNASLAINDKNNEIEKVNMETQAEFDYLIEKNSDDTIMVPEDFVTNEENKKALADIINSLSEVQRQAIYLYYYKNMSIKQVAEETRVSENTVKTRMLLAKKYIKSKVEEMWEQGVMLSTVPVSLVFAELEDCIAVEPIGAVTVSAGGFATGVSVITVASAAVIIGVSVMSGNYKDKIDIDDTRGDVRIVDSGVDSSWDSRYDTTDTSYSMTDSSSYTDLTESFTSSTDSSSYSDSSENSTAFEKEKDDLSLESQTQYQNDPVMSYVSQEYYSDNQNTSVQDGPDDLGWDGYLLSDIDGNPAYTEYWYTDKNDGSYIEVKGFRYTSDKVHIRYVMYPETLDPDYYLPFLIGIQSQKKYEPVRIYSNNNETVAEFNCTEPVNYSISNAQEAAYADENGVYDRFFNGKVVGFGMLCFLVSDDGTLTINKNLKYIADRSKDDCADYFGSFDTENYGFVNNMALDKYPETKRVVVEEGNEYFYISDNLLYQIDCLSDDKNVWWIWSPPDSQYDTFVVPDEIYAFHHTAFANIWTENFDFGDNAWMLTTLAEYKNNYSSNEFYNCDEAFDRIKTISFSNGRDPHNHDESYVPEVHISNFRNLESINIRSGVDDDKLILNVSDCPGLKEITIDRDVMVDRIEFADESCSGVKLNVYLNSSAFRYALDNDIPFEVIS